MHALIIFPDILFTHCPLIIDVFFSREEKKTWHSYRGDGISNRTALVYNLMTTKIKDVCKIENSSYLSTILRYKINPYLYRFFKKTI